jgi:endonuclease YncB( thermonuclease family)
MAIPVIPLETGVIAANLNHFPPLPQLMSRSSSRSRKPRPRKLWQTIGLLILLGAAYWYQQRFGSDEAEPGSKDAPAKTSQTSPAGSSAVVKKVNGYDRLDDCRLVEHRNNDGDSFMVRHGNRTFELRLYYVDSAEKYLSDRYENQRRRVGEQARDFGGITIDQTVELGQKAKSHTLGLITGKPFTVYTKWEQVYDGERYYCFLQLPGSEEYLSEELVEHGLARIHTKGEATPEGVSFYKFRDHLRAVEKEAKAADRGAWGL